MKSKLYILIYLFGFTIAPTFIYAQKISPYKKIGLREVKDIAEKGNLSLAKVKYEKILSEDSLSKYANYGLGLIYLKEKNYDQAINYFSRVKEDSTLNKIEIHDLMHNIGNAMYMQKKYKNAIDYYEESLIADPMDDKTRYNLVMAQKLLQNQNNKNGSNNKDNKNNDKKNPEDKRKPSDRKEKSSDQNNPSDQNNRSAPNEEKQLSKDYANNILKSFKDQEDNVRKKVQMKKELMNSKSTKTKNW